LTITKKAVTVTAVAISKVYGATDPTLTYTGGTLVGTDTFTGSLSRIAGKDVGTYAITSSLVNANYDITFVAKNLTITKKAVTVTAVAISKVYGATDPTLTYTGGTLLGTDTFTGSLSRTAGENVGTYAIASSLVNANYNITFVPKNLTITKASQTITFGSLTHTKDVFDLIATSPSGLTITYTSSDITVAKILGNTVTVLSAGSTNITAKQTGNSNYKAAPDVVQALTIIALGIDDENILLKKVKLYPNPSSDFIKISTGNEKSLITIFNINGKLIREYKNYTSDEMIDITYLKSGIYFVRIKTANRIVSKKFTRIE
jgi:hypothetical protein